MQSGNVKLRPELSLNDYITQYKQQATNDEIQKVINGLGLNGDLLKAMLARKYTRENLDLGRLNDLKNTVNKEQAVIYFDENRPIFLNKKIDAFLRGVYHKIKG